MSFANVEQALSPKGERVSTLRKRASRGGRECRHVVHRKVNGGEAGANAER